MPVTDLRKLYTSHDTYSQQRLVCRQTCNRLSISGSATGHLSACKTRSFALQFTAFCNTEDGLLQSQRQSDRKPVAATCRLASRHAVQKTGKNAMNKKVKNLARNDKTIKFAHNIDTPNNEYRQLDANSNPDNRKVVSTRVVERAVPPAPRRRPVTLGKGT